MQAPDRLRRFARLPLGLAIAVAVTEAFLLAGAVSLDVDAAIGGSPTDAAPHLARPTVPSSAARGAKATPSRDPRSPGPPPLSPEPAVVVTPRAAERTRVAAEVPPAPVGTLLPAPSAATGRGGGCPYLDRLTAHRSYADWALTLLDTEYRLPGSYAPRDLVDTSAAGLNRGYDVRRLVLDDLAAMATAARQAGTPFVIVSGYRSFTTQEATFRYWVRRDGLDYALRTSARPGHSEHQLGTAIDVTGRGDRDPWTYRDWGRTPAGAWIGANSWRFGFVISYPRGASARTCYDYEPWHLRYFGRERARAIIESGLTAREYLAARQ